MNPIFGNISIKIYNYNRVLIYLVVTRNIQIIFWPVVVVKNQHNSEEPALYALPLGIYI